MTTPFVESYESLDGLRFIGDRIIVRPIKQGTVQLIETARNEDMIGEVVALGSGALTKKGRRIPFSVSVGDKIVFGKHAIANVVIRGEKYLRIHENNVFGILC